MKYHTIKSERFNLRVNGSYATYPIYEHITGKRIGVMECFSSDLDNLLKIANEVNLNITPFFADENDTN